MKKTFSLFLIFSLILFGCEKEGPVGPEGAAGKDGVDGNDGSDGNANVQSITKSIAYGDWQASGTAGDGLYYYVEISIPEVTTQIVQDGTVMVYYKESDGFYVALPVTFNYYSSYLDLYYHTTLRFGFKTGIVRIEIEDSDMITYRPENTVEFKIVVIAGSTLKSLSVNFDFTNYQDVKERFGI